MQEENYFLRIAKELNQLFNWGLVENEIECLIKEVMPYVRACYGDEESVKKVINYFYNSRPIVRMLTNLDAPSWERDRIAVLWHKYLQKKVGLIWSRRGPIPGCDSEDVAQKAWEYILKGLKGFRFQSKLEVWIYKIVLNTDSDLRRRAFRRPPEPWEVYDGLNLEKNGIMPTDILTAVIRKEQENEMLTAIIESLVEVAQTRTRLAEWIEVYPIKLNELATKIIQVLIGDLSQHELAEYLLSSEPTVSRIINDMKKVLPDRLRERKYCSQTSNLTGIKEV